MSHKNSSEIKKVCVEKIENKVLVKGNQKNWLEQQEKELIRAELNLCKMLSIWETSQSKKKSKIIEQKEYLPDGSLRIKKIVIGQVGGKETGTFTIKKHFKTLLALVKLYEQAGRPEKVTFGVHQLAECLNLKWGRSTYNFLKEALEGLRIIPIRLENVFYNKQTGEVEELIDYFTWLDDLKLFGKLKNRQANLAISSFTFNSTFRQNILCGHTKPLFLSVITSLKTEVGILLYNHLDLVLADKNRYERNLKNLIEIDFRLDGKYHYSSDRKKLFIKPLKELAGVKLSTGYLAEIKLEKNKDGTDFKIVCIKTRKHSIRLIETSDKADEVQNDEPIEENSAQKLVRYFQEQVGQAQREVSKKELEQAGCLIAKHGEDQARYIVDYAIMNAKKTNFEMRWFGAVLGYVEESLWREEKERGQKQLEDENIQDEYFSYKLELLQQFKKSLPVVELEKLRKEMEEDLYNKFSDVYNREENQKKSDHFKDLIESFLDDKLVEQGIAKVLDFDSWLAQRESSKKLAGKEM